MGIIIVKPKLDVDAKNYIDAVQNADNALLEANVRQAINRFVVGCKTDGIWDAIKASCILAGARTLAGALVPLKGAAPINFNFVAGDYNRKTGLKGDGSTKHLNSNRDNNADPINNKHVSVYQTTPHTRNLTRCILGSPLAPTGSTQLLTATNPDRRFFRLNHSDPSVLTFDTTNVPGTWGASRTADNGCATRYGGSDGFLADVSSTPTSEPTFIFSRGGDFSDARVSFYSIGESLDLALLDIRISILMTTFNYVIP